MAILSTRPPRIQQTRSEVAGIFRRATDDSYAILALEVFEQFEHFPAGLDVEAARGFTGQDRRRF
jgi:hypothetical protein|tara:strand:- start:278 stop:472 length:195 start_codon:yes stop_codon:yes gene_type:complete